MCKWGYDNFRVCGLGAIFKDKRGSIHIGRECMDRNLKRFKNCKVEVSVSVYFNSQLAFITIIKDVLFQEGIYTVHARR